MMLMVAIFFQPLFRLAKHTSLALPAVVARPSTIQPHVQVGVIGRVKAMMFGPDGLTQVGEVAPSWGFASPRLETR